MAESSGNDPGSYCLICAELVANLSEGPTVFDLPCDVRFDPRNSGLVRTAIWRKGDRVELVHWTLTATRHMLVQHASRKRQSLVRLCEPPLRAVIERLKGRET